MGWLWFKGGFAPRKAVYLIQQQADALQLVTSAKGKFSRNLMKWNSDSLADLE
jgi:hypothetical protein